MRHRSAIFEVRQVRCLAQGQGIAKHGLDAGEPPPDSEWTFLVCRQRRPDSGVAVLSARLGPTLLPCAPGIAVMKGDIARAPTSGTARASGPRALGSEGGWMAWCRSPG